MNTVVRLSTEWFVRRKRGLLSWAEHEMRKHGAVVEGSPKKTQRRVGDGPQRADGRDAASAWDVEVGHRAGHEDDPKEKVKQTPDAGASTAPLW